MILKIKVKDTTDWAKAFAWTPVWVNDHTKVWLQRYERKIVGSNAGYPVYEHRLPGAAESIRVVYIP